MLSYGQQVNVLRQAARKVPANYPKIENEAARSNEALLKLVREIHRSINVPMQQSKSQALIGMRSRGSPQIANAWTQQLLSQPQVSGLPKNQFYFHKHPDRLKALNQERFIQGRWDFDQFGKTHFVPSSASRLNAARGYAASVDKQIHMVQLIQEIDSIASEEDSPDPEEPRNAEPRNEVDAISAWTRHLERLTDKWSANSAKRQVEMKTRLEGMHKFLLTLNRLVATREDLDRRICYTVMVECGIQRIFIKLRASLRSVTIEKEIQTFEEGLEELGLGSEGKDS